MPSGISASINKINSSSIVINFSSTAASTPLNGHDTREERYPTWVFTINGKNTTITKWSGDVTITYEKIKPTSNTPSTTDVKILFSCEVRYSDKYWEFSARKEFTTRKTSTASVKYEFVDSYIDEETKKTIYIYDIYTRETEYTDWIDTTFLNTSQSFYPHQENFTFVNCIAGKQWRVDKGINSLITNIQLFKYYATQWKSWRNQSPQSGCPDFFSSNKITAGQLNLVYSYVKGTMPWTAGTKISAAMFNDLATTINS